MSFVETEINGQIITIRLNRPERLNALSTVIRKGMAEAFNRYHEDKDLEVAILTGTGRGSVSYTHLTLPTKRIV